MNDISGIFILIGIMIWAIVTIWKQTRKNPDGTKVNSDEPKIIINFPDGAKKLENIPPGEQFDQKTLEGQKAILWWTVYKETMDSGSLATTGVHVANAAVDKVYGPK